jgi:hypothetical protein
VLEAENSDDEIDDGLNYKSVSLFGDDLKIDTLP